MRLRVPGWAAAARADFIPRVDSTTAAGIPTIPTPSTFVSRRMDDGDQIRLQLWARPALRRAAGDGRGRLKDEQSPAGDGPTLFGDGGSTTRHFSELRSAEDANVAQAVLRGVLHGPVLLAALTDGERTLRPPTAAGESAGDTLTRTARFDYLLLKTNYLLLTAYSSIPTAYHLLLTTDHWLLTTNY